MCVCVCLHVYICVCLRSKQSSQDFRFIQLWVTTMARTAFRYGWFVRDFLCDCMLVHLCSCVFAIVLKFIECVCLCVCFLDLWLHLKSGIPNFTQWVLRWSIVAKLGCKVVTASHEAQSATHRETVSLKAVCGADRYLMDAFIQSLKWWHTHRGMNVR